MRQIPEALIGAAPRGLAMAELRLRGEVLDWFEAHPASGVLPRAVAVEGVHTK
ncbi:DUF3322 domain-containing protein [Corynebacterium sp. A21]|uniref:DUF3322 domain-containing protein n=1 Tax=Corynebacterium sp. A21 TaxID=3457318 RepID=UPI003FD40548